jgi:hypothetical protein
MVVVKLTPEQHRRIAEVEDHLKTVSHLKHLVAELEANRAAPDRVVKKLCETIGRELSQMRQRSLTSNIGTIADVAGAMAVMASRGGGLDFKIRGLGEGVTSLSMQLEHALKTASTPVAPRPPKKPA